MDTKETSLKETNHDKKKALGSVQIVSHALRGSAICDSQYQEI